MISINHYSYRSEAENGLRYEEHAHKRFVNVNFVRKHQKVSAKNLYFLYKKVTEINKESNYFTEIFDIEKIKQK